MLQIIVHLANLYLNYLISCEFQKFELSQISYYFIYITCRHVNMKILQWSNGASYTFKPPAGKRRILNQQTCEVVLINF